MQDLGLPRGADRVRDLGLVLFLGLVPLLDLVPLVGPILAPCRGLVSLMALDPLLLPGRCPFPPPIRAPALLLTPDLVVPLTPSPEAILVANPSAGPSQSGPIQMTYPRMFRASAAPPVRVLRQA